MKNISLLRWMSDTLAGKVIEYFSYNSSSCCETSEISGISKNKRWYWLRITIRFCGDIYNEISSTRQLDLTSSRTNVCYFIICSEKWKALLEKKNVKSLLCTDKYVSKNRSVGIATRYLLDGAGLNPGVCAVFRTGPDWLWGPLSLLYNGYQVIPGVKWPGHGIDHPPPTSAVMEK
jgi:hypothetical protein